MARRILLIGADAMSTCINWRNRAFATVLGDAGTATELIAVPPEDDWFASENFWNWLDGSQAEVIMTPVGGSRTPLRQPKDVLNYRHCLTMDGQTVRELIVPFVGGPAIEAAMAKSGWSLRNFDLTVLHEANLVLNAEIVRHWQARGFAGSVIDAGGKFGNTTSASIPLALALHPEELTVGKRFGLFAFGGGFSVSIAVGQIKTPIAAFTNI
jgi:3-oxoacyl-[acyl-carrier-protein] synthase-3